MSKAVVLNDPPVGSNYSWKYMDLHKFLSFITRQSLFFTRLDKLDDPMESIATNDNGTSYLAFFKVLDNRSTC